VIRALFAAFLVATPAAAQDVSEAPGAVLRGLDKVSGTTADLTVRNGETVTYGSLTVTVSDCRYPKDNPAANAYAHLTIRDATGDAVFDGWMVASSPALSALDHPRYDIWVMRCISS
jgi:hypothetical protein